MDNVTALFYEHHYLRHYNIVMTLKCEYLDVIMSLDNGGGRGDCMANKMLA